ncbi:MAG: MATE family efflux transporter [Lachnospira sp.]
MVSMTRKKYFSAIFTLAWPAFIELTLTQLTNLVDLAMIGQLGTWALSAVGFTTQPKQIMLTVFIAVNTGATALVARYTGSGEYDKVNRVFNQAIILNIVGGIILSILGFILSEQFVIWMGATDPKIIDAATSYLQIQMSGMTFIAVSTCITACLRGIGNTKVAMMYNVAANVINVILNYMLIYGKFGMPRLEVSGASLATITGQTIACFIAIFYVIKAKNVFSFKLSLKFDRLISNSMLKVGLPAMGEQVIMRVGMLIFAVMIARLGTLANGTHQVCMSILGFSFMIGQAFAVSATTLVGQKLGEKKPDEASRYGVYSTWIAVFVSIVVGLAFILFNRQIIDLFSNDIDVINLGSKVVMVLGLVQPIQAVQFTLTGALRGAGDTLFAAVVTMITAVGVRLLVSYIFVFILGWGLMGAWIALFCDQTVRTVAIIIRYIGGKWKSINI